MPLFALAISRVTGIWGVKPMKTYLMNVILNPFFIIFVTAALGAAIGKIKIKGFSLGSAAGIFSGILIGWAIIALSKTIGETDTGYGLASKLLNEGIVSSSFMTFFLILFIAAVGLSVGGKIKVVLKKSGVKLVVLGVLIPVVSMALTYGCLKVAPSLMGDDYNGYEISGLYTGAMTNTAAYGTSLEVVGNMTDVQERYAQLDNEAKARALEMIGAEDSGPTAELSDEQAAAFLGKAKSHISLGYAITFPVGTIIIILAMSVIPILIKKKTPAAEQIEHFHDKSGPRPGEDKPFFFSAVIFGLVIAVGIIIGSIKIPLGGSVSFSLSSVGGVLISALVFSNISKIGPFDLTVNPKTLAFTREFSLIFFMSVVGLTYGYDVVNSFSGSGLVLALMAVVVETIAIIIAYVVGRYLMKMEWGLLSGAICGGCTSAVGLGAAISTVGTDEPALGYGAAQPFAILANVLLISFFHSIFFI